MRNLVLLLTAILLGTTATFATTADDKVAERNAYRYNNSFIFVEDGITFAVYPDGEFDFYIDNRLGRHRRNVTFNSGFDYSPYAQYDDYGAVIQVENIPIYYDYYGRVSQVGSIDINYRNGRVNRLGNMYVYYNRRGFYDYHTGFINIYNRRYIYRPFHSFFARPAIGFCFVRTSPYRRYYNPFRYTYYNPYRYNRRHTYAKIGKVHRYNQVRRERSSVYRNDKRVALRENRGRTNRTVARADRNRNIRRDAQSNRTRNSNKVVRKRSNQTATRSARGNSADRSRGINRNTHRKGDVRSSNGRTVKRIATRTPQRNTVTKRTVTQTPRSRTVTRSTKKYGKPQARSTQRSAQRTPIRSRSVQSRSLSSRSVTKAPSRSRSTSARSISSRTRSNRSAATSRSRGRQ